MGIVFPSLCTREALNSASLMYCKMKASSWLTSIASWGKKDLVWSLPRLGTFYQFHHSFTETPSCRHSAKCSPWSNCSLRRIHHTSRQRRVHGPTNQAPFPL